MEKKRKGSKKDKSKKKRLPLAIRRLSDKELYHFISAHCEDDKCPTCLKVWKAYGREPIKFTFKERHVEKDTETKLFRDNKGS